MADDTKYTMLLDEGAKLEVDRLQRVYSLETLETKADVYDLGLRVLLWMTQQQVQGREFGCYSEEEFRPLILPVTLDKNKWVN